MPTISLRLTDQEHAQLKEWAYGAHRSMQREAVYRIFSNHVENTGAVERQEVAEEPKAENPTRLPRTDAAPDLHFKPDFGKKL